MIYPSDCVTIADRAQWLRIQSRALRLYHNGFAKWFRDGITEAQYQNLPQNVRDNFAYEPKLSAVNWRRFLNEYYYPKLDRLATATSVVNRDLDMSDRWTGEVSEL